MYKGNRFQVREQEGRLDCTLHFQCHSNSNWIPKNQKIKDQISGSSKITPGKLFLTWYLSHCHWNIYDWEKICCVHIYANKNSEEKCKSREEMSVHCNFMHLFSQRDYIWKIMHSKSDMEEVFLNVFPFRRATLYIIILKTEKISLKQTYLLNFV